MAQSGIVLKRAGVTVLENAGIDRILDEADGDVALLCLYMARLEGAFDLSSAASVLKMDRDRAEKALKVLLDAGLADGNFSAACKMPDYSPEELAESRKNPHFCIICQALEAALGRILKKTEMQSLLDMYKRLGLSTGTIMTLIQYLGKTPGKRLTVRELEREACRWSDLGIVTEEKAEEHLKRLMRQRSDLNDVMKLLKLYDRMPSPSEERYINSWLAMGFPPEAIEIAYDKTVLKTGSLAWRYLNKILESWHSKGLHEAADIIRDDGKIRKTDTKYESDDESLNRVKNYLKTKGNI
ncbi:MAG: DnaD domain protein [Bacillota bacterium]|nr:DnaD domain protein [Bacillota bacterium]